MRRVLTMSTGAVINVLTIPATVLELHAVTIQLDTNETNNETEKKRIAYLRYNNMIRGLIMHVTTTFISGLNGVNLK